MQECLNMSTALLARSAHPAAILDSSTSFGIFRKRHSYHLLFFSFGYPLGPHVKDLLEATAHRCEEFSNLITCCTSCAS